MSENPSIAADSNPAREPGQAETGSPAPHLAGHLATQLAQREQEIARLQQALAAQEQAFAQKLREAETLAITQQHAQQIVLLTQQLAQYRGQEEKWQALEIQLQMLVHTEARLTELHEHNMALHRLVDNQAQQLAEQQQLLAQQAVQIQRLENRLESQPCNR